MINILKVLMGKAQHVRTDGSFQQRLKFQENPVEMIEMKNTVT